MMETLSIANELADVVDESLIRYLSGETKTRTEWFEKYLKGEVRFDNQKERELKWGFK